MEYNFKAMVILIIILFGIMIAGIFVETYEMEKSYGGRYIKFRVNKDMEETHSYLEGLQEFDCHYLTGWSESCESVSGTLYGASEGECETLKEEGLKFIKDCSSPTSMGWVMEESRR